MTGFPEAVRCPDCGTDLVSEPGLQGLCPQCLLSLALKDSPAGPDAGGPGVASSDGDVLATLDRPTPGRILGERYQIREVLGRGGMGEVFRAFDLRLRVEVALKAVRAEKVESERAREMLRQEVRSAREVVSPNVCRIFDLVAEEGQELVSMEYIDGTTLGETLKERGPLPLQEAREIASQFLSGLEAIHQAGLVHRDFKPENVMLTRAGRVVVMDFGLAKVLRDASTGTISGTPGYMPPEQARGDSVDARADVFAAGVVLAEMLSVGREGHSEARQALWRAIRETPPRPPEGPWAAVLRQALSPDPQERHASARALARALEEVTQRLPGFETKRPYPGLSAFTEEDAEYFFGREVEVEEVWKKLKRPRMLALIAPSGAGKSSFLRAGLLPTLPKGWKALVATPGERPFQALAHALAPAFAGDAQAVQALLRFEEADTAISLLQRFRQRHEHALVIVDQFEELFTLSPPETQAAFAELLGRLVLEADLHVILSLRDDFLFRCRDHAALVPAFADLTPLPALGESALRRALVQPALKCGYRFEDEALVDEMVSELQKERGALPLLAFAASRLWEQRDREKGLLTRAAYREIGGVAGALAQHAEATLERIGSQRTPLVRELFRNLVTAQGTRAVRERGELLSVFVAGSAAKDRPPGSRAANDVAPESRSAKEAAPGSRGEAEDVLNALVDARLLTSYERPGESGESRHQVEIIHESLLTAWPRLVRWQTQDADGAQLRDQLRQAAQLWQDRGKPADLLWSGTAYRDLTLWRERYTGGLTATEEAFAAAAQRLAGRQRRTRRIALASLLAGALAVAAVTSSLWRQARADALRAEAARLVALGDAEVDRFPAAALAYARKSLDLVDGSEARRLVVKALWSGPPARILPLTLGVRTYSAEFSPDGRWLATFPFSDKVLLFPDDGGPPVVIGGHQPPASPPGLAFTSDGGALLTQTPGQPRVRMLKIPEGKEVCWLSPDFPGGDTRQFGGWARVPEGVVFAVGEGGSPADAIHLELRTCDGPSRILGAFVGGKGLDWDADSSGTRLALVRDGRIFLRPLAGPPSTRERELAKIEGPGWFLFSPRGDAVVVHYGSRLRLWSLAKDAGPEPRVFHMAKPDLQFPPELDSAGTRLAWGSTADAAVSMWRLDGPADADPVILRRPRVESIKKATFHPGGRFLAVATHGSITLWDVGQPQAYVLRGHEGRIRQVRFTPDSERLVSCAREEGVVRVWPMHPRTGAGRTLGNPVGLCNDFAVAPDGKEIIVGGNLGAHVLPLAGGEGRRVMERPPGPYAVAFDVTGRRAAAAAGYSPSASKVLRVLDLAGGPLRELALAPPGESAEGLSFSWGVRVLAFTPEGHLIGGGDGGVRRFDSESRESHWIWRLERDRSASFGLSRDGRQLLATAFPSGERAAGDHPLVHFDLARGSQEPITTHGNRVTAVAMDPSAAIFVTGDALGAVRAGAADGREPHLLLGHQDEVVAVAVSPDGRWIASAAGSEIRLWPMPDVTRTPLHVRPLSSLLTTLRELTNLEVVEDPASTGGYRLEVGPFPGWKAAPTWQ